MSEAEPVVTLRAVGEPLGPISKPIVLKYKKPKKKAQMLEAGAQYSPELEDVQRLGTQVLRVTRKTANAFVKGLETYERERMRSANEKKDGAIADFLYNAGKATSVYLKETSDIPVDVTESIRQSTYQKRLRKRMRRISKAVRNWRR